MDRDNVLATTIQQVDVYRQQALITRQAVLQSPMIGVTTCVIADLPQFIVADSVRVHCSIAAIRVLDVMLGVQLSEHDGRQLTTLDQQIRQLKQKKMTLEIEEHHIYQQIDWLQQLKAKRYKLTELPEHIALKPIDPMASQLQLAEYTGQQLLQLKQRLRQLQRDFEQLQEQLQQCDDQRQQQSQAEQQVLANCRHYIQFQLDVPSAINEITIDVSYLLPSVFWAPSYEVRINTLQQPHNVELVVKAFVAQRCGEDWQSVALSFSSADLQRSTALPELDSWRIGKAAPSPASGWRDNPADLDRLFSDYQQAIPKSRKQQNVFSMPTFPVLPQLLTTVRECAMPVEDAMLEACVEELFEEEIEAFGADDVDMASMTLAGGMADLEADMPIPPPVPAAAPMIAEAKSAYMPRRAKQAKMKKKPSPIEQKQETVVHIQTKQDILIYQNLRLQSADTRQRGRLQATQQNTAIQPEKIRPQQLGLPKGTLKSLPKQGHFSVRYPFEGVAGSAQVLSNGAVHHLTLLRRQAEVRHIYRCVPALDTQVYHFAEFDNPLQLPLLAGEAQVYMDADFIVSTPLPTTGQKELISTNLGVESNIVIARNVDFRESNEGLFKGDSALIHRIEIKVRSRLKQAVTLEIMERIPYSLDEQIQVKILQARPTANVYTQTERKHIVKGGYQFCLTLDALSETTCLLEYQITLPNKKVLVGGNRRD